MFSSAIAPEMSSYIELRYSSLSESSFSSNKRALSLLDQYLSSTGFQGKELTEEILSSWLLTLAGNSKTLKEKIGAVRCFIKHLNSLCHHSFLPAPPKVKSDYIPYIYSDEEIRQIMQYADNLIPISFSNCSKFFQMKFPMAIRILYCCGTRIGETMALRREDIDFRNGTLFLRETKFSKERVIPIHESLLKILERYCLTLGISNQPNAYLFPGRKPGTHYTTRQMDYWFVEILKIADIDQADRKPNERGACIHCLRHLFVLKSMQQMEAAGHPIDMNDLLLPTYLGHESLLDTDKYMRFSGVQVPKSLDAFESFTAGIIPNVEVPYEEE